jgi:two-component system response regulator RegX3
MSASILLADDEQGILDAVGYALRQEGFDVVTATDGDTALQLARGRAFDVVVLDVLMPGMSGMDVCRVLRAESTVPIVLLTARDSELDRVLGLELGADDYVTKPFSTPELLSRVRALLRRRELDQTSKAVILKLGGIKLDLSRHVVEADGEPVQLTPSEFRVLTLLADEPGRVFTRRQIMEHLWQSPYIGDERASDVHISNLRRKIERDVANPQRIVTVRGVGYKLVPD